MLEYCNFLILFVLFVIALEFSARDHINLGEWGFIIYAAGESNSPRFALSVVLGRRKGSVAWSESTLILFALPSFS